MFEFTAPVVLAVIVGSLVGLIVRFFLFRVGCALADLPEQTVGKSLLAVLIALAVTIPLIVVAGYQLASLEKRMTNQAGMIFYPGLVLSLIVSWLLAAGVYALVLWISFPRGIIVAGVELLLSALLACLVAALILVIGAGWQISGRANPRSGLSPRPTIFSPPVERVEYS